jgi:hypothetical protein
VLGLEIIKTLRNKGLEIVDGLAPSEIEKETAHRVRDEDVGAPATLSSFSSTNWKNRMMMINLDQLAPYQGATWDEWP